MMKSATPVKQNQGTNVRPKKEKRGFTLTIAAKGYRKRTFNIFTILIIGAALAIRAKMTTFAASKKDL